MTKFYLKDIVKSRFNSKSPLKNKMTLTIFATTVLLSSLLILTYIPISYATPKITISNQFSHSEPNPGSCCPTKFYTLGPLNETGFNANENVTTNYVFPGGNCTVTFTADSTGKLYRGNPIGCAQGSAVYTGFGAHEGTGYNVNATGQSSHLSAITTFVPTLTNGSDWLAGSSTVAPKVINSTVHLAYFNPSENSSYNTVINNHNAISNFQKVNGTDYAISFNKNILSKYHGTNTTRILLEYNDSGNTNGIQQGISSAYNWIGYDDERFNGAQSTPCIEIGSGSRSESACPSGTSINGSAVGNYTNDSSQRVKNNNKHFVWAGELSAVQAAYKNINWTRIDAVVLQLQGPSTANSVTNFNSTLAQISDFVRSKNSNTLIFAQVNPGGSSSPCNCTMSSLVYDLQYARFHAGTPTKWLYDGVSMVINTTPPSNVDTFDSYLGR